MADTQENITKKLDNVITKLNMLLNENDITMSEDELINYNFRVMLHKKRIKEIASENILLNRIMELYNLGIF